MAILAVFAGGGGEGLRREYTANSDEETISVVSFSPHPTETADYIIRIEY